MLSVGEVKELKVAVAVAIIKSKPRGLPAEVYTRSVIHRWDNSRLSANEYITSLELERIKLRQKLYLRDKQTEPTASPWKGLSKFDTDFLEDTNEPINLSLITMINFFRISQYATSNPDYVQILMESIEVLPRYLTQLIEFKEMNGSMIYLRNVLISLEHTPLTPTMITHMTELTQILIDFLSKSDNYITDEICKDLTILGRKTELKSFVQGAMIEKLQSLVKQLSMMVICMESGRLEMVFNLLESLERIGSVSSENRDMLKELIDITLVRFPLLSVYLLKVSAEQTVKTEANEN